eukprot:6210907-Pleurochrysis_carterae.AAC.1
MGCPAITGFCPTAFARVHSPYSPAVASLASRSASSSETYLRPRRSAGYQTCRDNGVVELGRSSAQRGQASPRHLREVVVLHVVVHVEAERVVEAASVDGRGGLRRARRVCVAGLRVRLVVRVETGGDGVDGQRPQRLR